MSLTPADIRILALVFGFGSVEEFGEFVVDQSARADERALGRCGR